MKKILYLVFTLVITSLLFNGCKKDVPSEELQVSTDVVTYAPWTHIINDESAQVLESVDSVTVSFIGNTPQLESLEVGDIIGAGILENAPEGFLRRITQIEKIGGGYRFTTEEVGFTDAFEELHIDHTQTFSVDDTSSGKTEDLQFNVSFPNVVMYDSDGNYGTTNDQVRLNGNIRFTPSLSVMVDISSFQLQSAKIESGFESEVSSSLTAGIVSLTKEITIYQQPLNPFVIPGTIIVITPYLRVNLGANGQLGVSVVGSVTNTNKVDASLEYVGGAWQTSYSRTMSNSYDFLGMNGDASLKAYVEPGMNFVFWGSDLLKGSMVTQGYMKLNGELTPEPSCALKAGVNAGMEAQLKVFDFQLNVAAFPEMFEYETTLYTCLNADFSASDTSITEGTGIFFIDESSGNPTSWEWSFPGATPSSSTEQDPAGIFYDTPGSYDVTLIATNEFGSDTITKNDYVTVDQPPSLQIGDLHEGGVIIYLDSTGMHGIVVCKDHWGPFRWGCWQTSIPTSSDFGSGPSNTLNMQANCAESNTAGNTCDCITWVQYDDWYLPSKDELELFDMNREIVSLALVSSAGQAITGNYWSSTQVSTNPNYAWVYVCDNVLSIPGSYDQFIKHNFAWVRPIRNF